MLYTMYFNDIAGAWIYGVDTVLREGSLVDDERGDTTIEVENLMMTILRPVSESIYNSKYFEVNNPIRFGLWSNNNALEPYVDEFLTADKKGFVYTYGNRLREFFDVNQIDYVKSKLDECLVSRRATCVTWSPQRDTVNDDVPCLMLVDFKVRDNQLNVTGVWRSHDIMQAYYPNMVGLTYLAKEVANHIGVMMGTITSHSISAHIRYNDFEEARELVNQCRF